MGSGVQALPRLSSNQQPIESARAGEEEIDARTQETEVHEIDAKKREREKASSRERNRWWMKAAAVSESRVQKRTFFIVRGKYGDWGDRKSRTPKILSFFYLFFKEERWKLLL